MNLPKDSNFNLSSFQDSILGTLMKFESAISGLTQTVEQTRHNIEHVVDLSTKSKEELKHIKESVLPYLSTARDTSQRVVNRVRSNPRSIALVGAGIVGGLLLLSLLKNRSDEDSSVAVH